MIKTCEQCNKEFQCNDKRTRFCNRSCSAIFNNKKRIRNNTKKICKCGETKDISSKVCRKCYNETLSKIENRNLSFYIDGKNYLSSKCQDIRFHARKVIEKSDKERCCKYCTNNVFKEVLEVHHIKGILKFNGNATIQEINHLDNLMWICPSHHRMIEKGLIL